MLNYGAYSLYYIAEYIAGALGTSRHLGCGPKSIDSIERFIEGQAFSRSNDLAPRPPPVPSVSSNKPQNERQLADGRGGRGGGQGAESYDSKKAWSSINHSILSDAGYIIEQHHAVSFNRGWLALPVIGFCLPLPSLHTHNLIFSISI